MPNRLPITIFLLSFTLLIACGDDTNPMMPDGGGDVDATVDATPDAEPMVDCSDRPSESIDTRGEHQGVYDAVRGRIVIYGGNTSAPEMCMPRYNLVGELWAFHLDCQNWEPIAQDGMNPGIRARQGMTVDTRRGRALLFGGRDRVGFGEYENFNDVWALDLETDTWTEITTSGDAPTPKSTPVVAYDETNDRLLVFGGNTSTGGLTLTGTSEFHALDLETGVWAPIDAAGAPSPRLWHSGTIAGGELYIFGGTPDYDGPFLNDTHAFDLSAGTWREVHSGRGTAPKLRFGGELYADAANGRLLLFGGHDAFDMGNSNDVWALDIMAGTWSNVRPGDTLNGRALGVCRFPADFTIPEADTPERRYGFAHVQDAEGAYIIGGKTDCGNTNDVWRLGFDTNEWESLRTTTEGEACNRSGRTTCTELCF